MTQENRKRIGNDYNFSWPINYKPETPGGEAPPYDLTGRALVLYLIDTLGNKVSVPFTTEGNVISWTFYGKDQKRNGRYYAELCENKGQVGMITLDTRYVITLVPHTDMENDAVDGTVSLTYIALEASNVITRGPKGDKGDKGDPGPQGPQGPQGIQGERGPQGGIVWPTLYVDSDLWLHIVEPEHQLSDRLVFKDGWLYVYD